MHKEERPVAGAPVMMRRRGELTDSLVLKEVKRRPGSTIREISMRLNMSNGRVDGSVNRLVSQRKVKVKHFLRRGILIKRVYPVEFIPKSKEIIEVPRELVEDSLWKEEVYIYALSRSTIGISPQDVEEWDKKSILKEKAPLFKKEESLVVELPASISEFYQLENSEISFSMLDNLVLLTVESILPVSLPATYPEEATIKITSLVGEFKFRIEEKVVSFNPSSSISVDVSEGKAIETSIPSGVAYSSVLSGARGEIIWE